MESKTGVENVKNHWMLSQYGLKQLEFSFIIEVFFKQWMEHTRINLHEIVWKQLNSEILKNHKAKCILMPWLILTDDEIRKATFRNSAANFKPPGVRPHNASYNWSLSNQNSSRQNVFLKKWVRKLLEQFWKKLDNNKMFRIRIHWIEKY